MRNFPAHIPASQSQTFPPQRREPASASATQIDILYLSFILSDFFDFMRIPEVRELSFHFSFSLSSCFRHFFYASFRRVGRFRFRGVKRYYLGNPPRQWHLPEYGDDDGDWGGYIPPAEPKPQPPKPVAPTPTDRSKLSGKSEYLLKAGFKSQRDLEEVEPWPKGRPEVRCCVAFHDGSKESIFFDDRGWWNGKTKDLNIQFWKWADEAKPGDYYTIKWIEDDEGTAVDLSLSYTYKGITGKVGFKWNDDDDTIGERSVHYTDEALSGGKLYDLGGFRFWIAVK